MKIFPLRLSKRKSLQPIEVLSSTTLTQEIRLQVQMTIVGIKCKWRQNGSNKWNMKLKKGKFNKKKKFSFSYERKGKNLHYYKDSTTASFDFQP